MPTKTEERENIRKIIFANESIAERIKKLIESECFSIPDKKLNILTNNILTIVSNELGLSFEKMIDNLFDILIE